ncbi:4-hydroxybenzoate 3-monooxygenase [Nocardioides alcanivorans]|uniref:4-hydroxybenzoate 3-monooxygenase n=1 Tax=Nocardioides alcanivorans TaxID=2897352 RepID=UPI001F3F6445|nr:4-hydroxybenzoate 3-monooxygenase [Nocardioides alcanivorans]
MTASLPPSTPVVIIGAGPAGLLLAHLLHLQGVESVILERRSREHVLGRVRAGVLEDPVVRLLHEVGASPRLAVEGMVHGGVNLQHDGQRHRIDLTAHSDRAITVYGQRELVADLIELRESSGLPLHFDADVVGADGVEGDRPTVHVETAGVRREVRARFLVGVDGARSRTRELVPAARRRSLGRSYPVAWLGVLARAVPATEELIYARHDDGFALASMRTPEVSRLYLQVPHTDALEAWDDERIWKNLHRRLDSEASAINEGPILERSLTPLRSVVHTTMRHGSLLLAGDAAHVVPPTGAKGLNLAVADVVRASAALVRGLRGDLRGLDDYQEQCLERVWRAVHFSWWMTTMFHTLDDDPFTQQMQQTQLRMVTAGGAMAAHFADLYTGAPFEGTWHA